MKLQTPSEILCIGRRRILRNTNDYIRVLVEKFVTQMQSGNRYSFGSARISAEMILFGIARGGNLFENLVLYCIKNGMQIELSYILFKFYIIFI